MKQKILLVMPEFKLEYTDVPFGLLSLATYIKRNNSYADVRIYDDSLDNLSSELSSHKPDIIGLYMTTLHINISKKYLKIIRRVIPHAKVILGGPATVCSLDELKRMRPDVIILGEGEIPFIAYLDSVRNNKKLNEVSGIVFYNGKKYVTTNPSERFLDLHHEPLPDYSLIDIEKYIKKWYYFDYLNGLRGISMVTSRGCPYMCKFCYPVAKKMYGLRIRAYDNRTIVSKIKELKKKYKINAVFFHDDTFTLDKKRAIELCKMLVSEKVNIKWGCNSRVDCIDDELCKIMKSSGCVEVRLGIESFNACTLSYLNKKTNISEISESIEILKRNNIKVFAFIIIGSPNESIIDIINVLIRLSQSNIDIARISILTNLPGTLLSESIKSKTIDTDNYDYIKSSRNNCSSIPFFILDLLRKMGYFIFYFSPKRLFTTLRSFNSIDKIKSKLERI